MRILSDVSVVVNVVFELMLTMAKAAKNNLPDGEVTCFDNLQLINIFRYDSKSEFYGVPDRYRLVRYLGGGGFGVVW